MDIKIERSEKGRRIGVVHPGVMGVFLAASMVKAGCEVYWASQGRSVATVKRAKEFQLRDAGDLAALCNKCEVLVSVCPPHGALALAEQAAECSFKGIYLDANAVSPRKVEKINGLMSGYGIDFVDGGIIGRPDWEDCTACLYLSGKKAEEIAKIFSGGYLRTKILGEETGQASALKMCYAANTKGVSALLAGILSLAEKHHIRNELAARWEEDWPGFYDAAGDRVKKAAAKAWRFEGEMKEIAETFADAGLPGGFHLAAAEVYERLGEFKDMQEIPAVESILKKISR